MSPGCLPWAEAETVDSLLHQFRPYLIWLGFASCCRPKPDVGLPKTVLSSGWLCFAALCSEVDPIPLPSRKSRSELGREKVEELAEIAEFTALVRSH